MADSDRTANRETRPRSGRVEVSVPVSVWDGRQAIPGQLHNLSVGGTFVALEPPIPIGTALSFWLQFRGDRLLVRGTVRWTRSLPGGGGEPVGIGLEFADPDGSFGPRIRDIIERLSARQPRGPSSVQGE